MNARTSRALRADLVLEAADPADHAAIAVIATGNLGIADVALVVLACVRRAIALALGLPYRLGRRVRRAREAARTHTKERRR